MSYLLLEPKVKAIAPNIALMKWARWCENNGYQYQYVRGIVDPDIEPDKILMSCIFSYNSKRYDTEITHYLNKFPDAKFIIGGVFPSLNPHWFNKPKWQNPFFANFGFSDRLETKEGLAPEIDNLVSKFDVEIKSEDTPYPRDKIVLYTSRGCVNKCGYCAVPKLEGDMNSFKSIKEMLDTAREDLPDAKSIVLYDNNFTEHEALDNIVNELVDFELPVDIHGLHVDSFTEHIAQQFSRLKWAAQGEHGTPYLRFSFDKLKYRDNVQRAFELHRKYKIGAQFFCYMLYNWIDTPRDFWNRLLIAQDIVDKNGGIIYLFPQRYEPFMALTRNSYIGKKWSKELVKGIVRQTTSLRGFIPMTKSKNTLNNYYGPTYNHFIERMTDIGSKPDEDFETSFDDFFE